MMRSTAFRLCVAAFFADLALYLVMTGVPYQALALGAGPVLLGLLPAARGLPYSVMTVWAGRRTEGRDRLRWARWSVVVAGLAALALALNQVLPGVYLWLAVIGAALAFFWPPVQATFGDLHGGERLTRHLAWFNIAWSLGKGCGFLVGGMILSLSGFPTLFTAAALALGVVVLVVSGASSSGSASPVHAPATKPEPPHPQLRPFRNAAWGANAITFGVSAVLNLHYPQWLETLGLGESLFGTYLGLIFLSQTATFAIMARSTGWRYRRAALLLPQVPLVLVSLALPWIHAPWGILATAPVLGVGMGMSYFASIFYSVAGNTNRGRNAGVHEALLGMGSLGLPLLGGLVAGWTGRLADTYLCTAGVVAVGLFIQLGMLRGSPRLR